MALALVLTLALRGLYLARFGWDPMWVNAVYLAQAKSLVVGEPRIFGPPLALFALVGERALGLSPIAALALLALGAHVAFACGTIALARAVWPRLPQLRERALALLVAATPLVAGHSGYEDIGALLGAAFFVCLTAASLTYAARRSQLLLVASVVCAFGGAAARTEAVAGGVALALILTTVGPRHGLPAARRAAFIVVLGVLAGVAATVGAHRLFVGRFELADPTYPFYTFYVGLPPRMCESPCRDEYRAYAASARRFGTVGDNHGSLACAVLGHPRALAVRTIYKLGECAECIGDPRVAGLLLPLSVLGLVRGGRRPGGRSFMLVAFAGPALVLLVPPSVPMYFLIVLPPLLLAAALGTEGLLLHASNGARVAVAFALTIFGITWAGHYGWPGPSISPVLNRAARAIEERCRSGCLTNYLPPHVAAEAWVQLDAGASLPRHQATEESFVYGEVSPAFAAACRYKDRVARARAEGYFGPVLYLEVCTPTAHAFSDLGFDREHDLEGPVDLSHARLEAAFTEGLDTARLWSFPAGSLP